MKILVTSAGGPAAIGVMKSLQNFDGGKNNHSIIATDITELSAGFLWADKGFVVPKADDINYLYEIKKIILDEKIDVILPTGNLEIDKFESLSNMTNVFMSDSETIKLCNDKWKFYNKVKDDFDIPHTWQYDGIGWKWCFARPRYELGGSRGTFYCKDILQYMFTHNSDVEYNN